MENDSGNYWTCSDNIEDIEADQTDGILSMSEYGRTEDTLATEQMRLQRGYGRGIPTQAAYSELAADIRKYNPNTNRMGQLLTTDDILQLNLHDEDKDNLPETTAMLRSVGINKYDDSRFSSYNKNEESNKILSKPIINGKSFPILLDDSYHKFERKPRTPKVPEVDNENNNLNEDNSSRVDCDSKTDANDASQSPTSTSNKADNSIIGFASVLMPNGNEKHIQRHKQPTIGIGKEIFVKPIEVYFTQKAKQSKKKKLSLDNSK